MKEKENISPLFDISTKKGFEALYRTYFKKMHSIAHAKTNCSETAGSIVHEVFLKIWDRRDKLVFEEPAERYLMRALSTKIVDHFRASAVRKKHLEKERFFLSRSETNTEDTIGLNELQGRICSLMDSLPEKSQKIYILSREKGLSIKQISESLSVPERTISRHLSKTLSFLENSLKKDYNIF